jgi:hypothetical protein
LFTIHERCFVLALFCLSQAGCAYLAKTPNTPAATVNFETLNVPDHPPGERYYLLVFGSQSSPKVPRYTHTWITLIRALPKVEGDKTPIIEENTISWMPATLDIHPYRFQVEPGVNLDLNRSIQNALDSDQSISMWGPFEVPVGLYRKGKLQKAFMESGELGYQCIDTIGEAAIFGNGSNCVHAITDADYRYDRQAYPLAYYGKAASENLLRQIVDVGGIQDPYSTHDWLLPQLKLDQYPIVRSTYRPSFFSKLTHSHLSR